MYDVWILQLRILLPKTLITVPTAFSCVASRNKQYRAAPPGYRDAGNVGRMGALTHVGNYGSCYSSSISGSKGVYLDFSAPNLRIGYASSRGHGIQLRCLSE